MKKLYLLLLMCCVCFAALAQTSNYAYTGAVQTYSVQAGVYSLAVNLIGAAGGSINYGGTGGPGGRLQCTLSVTPGNLLYVYLGKKGTPGSAAFGGAPAGGTNSGGGADGGAGSSYDGGGAGGASSDIRTISGNTQAALSSRLVVAGGGGGGGYYCGGTEDNGGGGGGLTGGTGLLCGTYNSGEEGTPGTPTTFGTAGVYFGYFGSYSGTNGAFGKGGRSYNGYGGYGGGGGGGWFGGGGAAEGGGCGGSGYAAPGVTSGVIPTTGFASATANGSASITQLCNPVGTITGNAAVCFGTSFTLSDATGLPQGTWSSSNTSIVSVNQATGRVIGVAPGTATITFNVPNACAALPTTVVTINPVPNVIGGVPVVCTGIVTPLSESATGGSWTSSNTSISTVDGFGNVSGVTYGLSTITYTLPGGCYVTQPVTVNVSPTPLTGTAVVCVSSSAMLVETLSGGVWSSSAGTTATVDALGNYYGVSSGTSNISYTLPTTCFASRTVTVNGLPPLFVVSVSGNPTYCAGTSNTASILLTGSTVGVNYKLFNGSSVVSTLSGTGAPLNFGIPSAPGTYTVSGSNAATGCLSTMLLSATIAPKALPSIFNLTHIGSSFCNGGAGVIIGLSGSAIGVNYQLYKDGAPVAASPLPGTGLPLSFGAQYLSGNYTIVATGNGAAPNCVATMAGNAVVTVNSLPDTNNITGGGAFCPGATGVLVGLDYSDLGISYQLTFAGVPVGSPVLGSGGALSFGLQTAIGSAYSVIATNTTTGCTSNMRGSATVSYAPLPTLYDVTGGGSYCAGGEGYAIGIDGSDAGVNYQLYRGATPVGAAVGGMPGAFNFGIYTTPGLYTVVATDQTYHCVSNMNDSAVIAVVPAPGIYDVTGGGSYCAGGAGLPAMLSGSQNGVTYTLFNGTTAVDSLHGTGGSLNFGYDTTAGSYTVVAVNPLTTCSSTMTGSAIVAVNPLPAVFNVTGGGNYCAGGIGIDLGLDLSTVGVNYQLYYGGSATGAPIAGTGSSLDFGNHSAAGTYTIVGTYLSGPCSSNMSGSATISINPLPGNHTVSGGGSYCVGGLGKPVNIAGSDLGVTYQLFNSTSGPVESAAGTGGSFSFGLQTVAGLYTVVALDTTTLCSVDMPGAATIVVDIAPSVFSVTGGGAICGGTSEANVGLSNSASGVQYLLYNGATLAGTLTGTGSALSFGLLTSPGIYSITGTNTATGCGANMDGTALIISNPSPAIYSVIGGGGYCSGSATIPSIGLSGSNAGINYQLYMGSTAIGSVVTGTGAAIDLGPQSVTGTYTIVATDTRSTCSSNMSGSAAISVNSLPSLYTVTGGGSYCAGGAGEHIFMSISSPGIQYVLYYGGFPVDTITGTGAGLDFGVHTSAGAYTAVATNPATGCASNMAGSATIVINSLPGTHTVTVADGGNYCATGTGVDVGLDGSNSGINYQLYNGLGIAGSIVSGSGGAIDFGTHTTGNYTVVATNPATGCKNNMTGSAVVHAIPVPNIYATTGGGNYCTTGLGLHVGLAGSDSGTQYQLYNGTSMVGTPMTATARGGAIDFGLYSGAGVYTVVGINGGATGCASNMSGAAVIAVYPVVLPVAGITTSGGDTACFGNITHFTASAINGGTSPVYNWSVNGVTVASGSTFSYLPTNGDRVTLALESNAICAIPDTNSKTISISVSPMQAPSVNVTATPGDVICEGSPVTFTATSLYGGQHPVYTWIKNSTYVVGTGLTLMYTPANSDIIMLRMISDFPCRLADTAFSNTNTIEADPPVIPIVTITANPGLQISAGQSVTFSASVLHSGGAPTYQWLINGSAVRGANNATFTTSGLSNNDSVSCVVIGGCELQGFNSVRVDVAGEGVAQITTSGNDNIMLIPNPNKGLFTIKGALANVTDEEVLIEVVNMLGQAVYSNRVMTHNGSINETIQLGSSLANGMYLLNLCSGSQRNVFHFVVEQ